MATATGYLTFGINMRLLISDSHFTDTPLGNLRDGLTHSFDINSYLSNDYDLYDPAITSVAVSLQEDSDQALTSPTGTESWGTVSDSELDTEMTAAWDATNEEIDIVIPSVSEDKSGERYRVVVVVTQPDTD